MTMAKAPAGGADFVAKIVKDPKQPPATVMLTGFLGASSEEGHTRLYFDANLSSYVEIPNDAILHTQDVATEQGGLGGSYVWINRDAELIHGPAGSQRPKGKFLEGPIMQAHLQGAFAGGGAAAGGAGIAAPQFQTLHATACCPPPPISFVVACPPTLHQVHCPPFQTFVNCPTQLCSVGPACQISHVVQCPLPTTQPPCGIASAQFICPPFGPCPSIACQSIACQSIACQPGGGVGGGPAALAATAACQTLPQNCGIVPPSFVNCPTHAPLLCPVTPHCPTHPPLLCPVTPHCPPTPHAPCQSWICPPTPPVVCATHVCTVPPQCPFPSAQFVCPSFGPCFQTVGACQQVPGGGQGPVAAAALAGGPAAAPNSVAGCNTLPVVCQVFTPACPPHITIAGCPTQPAVCHPFTPACPPHVTFAGCHTPPVVCQVFTPACPPTHHQPCPTGPTVCCVSLPPACFPPVTPLCPVQSIACGGGLPGGGG
jgi:hypothetical protein